MARSLEDIRLRDPFILPVEEEACYYLYGTTDPDCWGPEGIGFDCYRSADLRQWEGPIPAFRPESGFWGTHHFWAPEVHRYRGRYYMFASFKANDRARGTQVLVADSPRGPFCPHSKGPLTPPDWESLDGTLYFDREDLPWMVFCREWTQVTDGSIAAIELTPDLREVAGEAVHLFHGSEAPWSVGFPEDANRRVTDGPWLHRTRRGRLLMLWSTVGAEGYTLGCAYSTMGGVLGPWKQVEEPLFRSDGGHAMLFRDFRGKLMLALHQPNQAPHERARLFPVEETEGDLLRITQAAHVSS